ncbi:MAG TPA: RraA family protein [bacterium]
MTDTAQVLHQLRTFDTPTVSNAIESLAVRNPTEGYLGRDVRCMTPELGAMVGYAVTVTIDNTSPARNPQAVGVQAFYKALAAAPKPAVIVIQDLSAHPSHSCHIGDVVSSMSKRLGAVGVVTNGAVRDLKGIQEVGFHVFAAGITPSRGIYQWISVNVPVTLSRVTIQPGDLLHGDANGIVTVPPATLDRLPAACVAVREKEQAMKDFANSPEFTLDGLLQRLK